MRVGLSTNGKKIEEALFQQYAAAGIEMMEISVRAEEYDGLDLVKIGEWAKKYGIALWSYHLPFYPFETLDISAIDETIRSDSVALLSRNIRRAAGIGIKKYVLHGSGEPIEDAERPLRMEAAKKSIKELAETAAEAGGTLCVEDLPRTCLGNCSAEILDLISVDERVRVCFDTNHLLGESLTDFVKNVGSKIVTTHISDYDFVNERHWLPGEGDIDWKELYGAFKEAGYEGAWLYEIPFHPERGIVRERNLTCMDYVKNAKEIFCGKELTVIGHPREGIGYWE